MWYEPNSDKSCLQSGRSRIECLRCSVWKCMTFHSCTRFLSLEWGDWLWLSYQGAPKQEGRSPLKGWWAETFSLPQRGLWPLPPLQTDLIWANNKLKQKQKKKKIWKISRLHTPDTAMIYIFLQLCQNQRSTRRQTQKIIMKMRLLEFFCFFVRLSVFFL